MKSGMKNKQSFNNVNGHSNHFLRPVLQGPAWKQNCHSIYAQNKDNVSITNTIPILPIGRACSLPSQLCAHLTAVGANEE